MSDATTNKEELRIERVFDAPRELVFKAWLDPDQLSQWYGPEHFEAPQDRIAVEPEAGGRWELVMVQGGSGDEHTLRSRIVELVEPELLVIENETMPEHGMDVTRTRVEFHDEGGKTRMVLTDGPYEGRMGEMAGQGWAGAFDKLAGVVTG
jgi:uncharacterized protein YndB with AHSA1/START domain